VAYRNQFHVQIASSSPLKNALFAAGFQPVLQ
jgi:hypothetical protein